MKSGDKIPPDWFHNFIMNALADKRDIAGCKPDSQSRNVSPLTNGRVQGDRFRQDVACLFGPDHNVWVNNNPDEGVLDRDFDYVKRMIAPHKTNATEE